MVHGLWAVLFCGGFVSVVLLPYLTLRTPWCFLVACQALSCCAALVGLPLPLLACLAFVMLPGTPGDISWPLIPVIFAGVLYMYKPCHARSVYVWYTLGVTILMLYQGCSAQMLFLISGPSRFVCGVVLAGILTPGHGVVLHGFRHLAVQGAVFAPFFLTRVGRLPVLQWWVCVAVGCCDWWWYSSGIVLGWGACTCIWSMVWTQPWLDFLDSATCPCLHVSLNLMEYGWLYPVSPYSKE